MTELGHSPSIVGALEDVHEPGRVDAMFDRIDDMKDKVHDVTDAMQANYQHISERYRIQEKLEDGKKYALEHPILTLFVCSTICMCAFPIACFLAFVISSIFFTFLGCLFVEGFLLSIGGFFLVVSLFVVGFLSILFSSFLLASWYSINLGHKIVSYAQERFHNDTHRPGATGDGVKDQFSEKED